MSQNTKKRSWKVKDTSKMGRVWKDKTFSKTHKQKLTAAMYKRKERDGYINSPKTRQKLRKAMKGKTGDKSSNWKGGLSYVQKQEKIAGRKQPKNCEICGIANKRKTYFTICFDHNHETGEFRGWICRRCNTVLGLVEDNPKLLILLSKYLEK